MTCASRSKAIWNRAAPAALFPGLCLVVACAGEGQETSAAVQYVPADSVPRLTMPQVDVDEVGRIVSFDLVESTLYLLDGLNHQVVVLERQAGGDWTESVRFGRRGSGPGEFEMPSSVAVLRDDRTVVVADGPRLNYFTRDGEHLRQAMLRGPCAMNRPELAAASEGLLIAGSCWSGDSLALVLVWTPDGQRYTELARDVRVTRTGRAGSFLVAGGIFPAGGSHYFGSGASACVFDITAQHGELQAARQCDASAQPYRAPPSARAEAFLREQQRQRPAAAAMFTWPSALPFYRAWLSTASGDVLFRQFSSDSLVMRRHEDGGDSAVLTINGLVGCRQDGCLWEESTTSGTIVRMLDRDMAGHYANAGGRQ